MTNNIYQNIPDYAKTEIFEDILKSENIRIERIISYGPESNDSEWYEQNENEWVILIEGKAKLIFEDSELILEKGDHINIPAMKRHKVEIIEKENKCIWIAVFYK